MLTRFRNRFGRVIALAVILSFVGGQLPVQGQGRSPSAPAVTSGGKLVTLKFRDAPLDQILGFYAELTGRTMIKAPGINATITLRAQTRLTQDEALQAIETILAMNNITLVPMGDKFFKVIQIGAARQEGMKTEMGLPDEVFPETDHLISQIIDLKYLEISDVQPIIQGLMHSYGKIQPLERTNSLLITETAANLQRILEILDYIDRPAEAKVETRIYELRYAEAGKVASRLNELIADAQAKESKPRVTPPTQPRTPPGVIRARRPAQPGVAAVGEVDLAERGIIQGKVKLVADERTNILIVISHPSNFLFFDKIVAVLDRPVDPDIIVRVVALEYADAEEIAGILNEFVGVATADKRKTGVATGEEGGAAEGRSEALREYVRRQAEERIREAVGEEKAKIGQLSPSTKILADKRTNSLLLMGRKSDIAALEDIIDQLDIMLAQVLIEVVILEIGLNDDLEYGIDWLQRSLTVYNENVVGPRGGIKVREPVFSFGGGQRLSEGSTFRDGSQIQRDSITLSPGALTYYATFFDFNIDAVIRLAASSSEARILSTPVILTTDNTEAKITVGEERPVVTSTTTSTEGAQTSQYEYRNIGINLTVTPRINPQRFVVMEIVQTVDDLGGTVVIDGNDVPIITTREFQAQIAVENRSTIVLGGLVSTDKRLSRAKVPVLGDIPLLGTLFRSDRKEDRRRELLVLITPYVLMTPEEAHAETLRLNEAIESRRANWPVGWTDSPLAPLTPAEIKAAKKAEKKAEKERKRREATERKAQRKLELRMNLGVPAERKMDVPIEKEPAVPEEIKDLFDEPEPEPAPEPLAEEVLEPVETSPLEEPTFDEGMDMPELEPVPPPMEVSIPPPQPADRTVMSAPAGERDLQDLLDELSDGMEDPVPVARSRSDL